MTTYSSWFSGQLVEQVDMLDAMNDLYQRLTLLYADRPIPYIVSGLTTTINSTGLVTVAAGNAIDKPFNQSDYAALPGNNLASIGQLAGSGTCQVTAVGPEYGIIVLRQTITPITSGEVLYTIVSNLVYVVGSSSAYPALGLHDIPLVGVITSGITPAQTYLLDYSQRALDQYSYASTIQGIEYFANPHFDNWDNGIGPFTSSSGAFIPTANDWSIFTTAGSSHTAQQYTLADAEQAIVPNTPIYGLQIDRVTIGSGGDQDGILQVMPNYQTLNGKYVTFSTWIKATAASDLNGVFYLAYGNESIDLTQVVTMGSNPTIIADGQFHLYTLSAWVPNLITTPGAGTSNEIGMVFLVDSDIAYTLVMTEAHLVTGKYYIAPVRNPLVGNSSTSNFSADTGTVNALVANFVPAVKLIPGLEISVQVANTNTTTSPTININGLGVKNITRVDTTAVAPGDLLAAQVADMVYDGTQFQLMNPRSSIAPARLFTDPGYTVLPGGYLEQWGHVVVLGAPGSVAITFPIPFPNTVFTIQISAFGTGVNGLAAVDGITTTGAMVNYSGTGDLPTYMWRANGY